MTQKAVFVSGAGRGIGRNIAERFAKEGFLTLIHIDAPTTLGMLS